MWNREIEPHTVLYLSLEDTFNRLQKRLLQLVGSEEAPERLVMQTECSSIGQGLEEQLVSFIYQHPDTGLIVIDTLQKMRSSDQNNSMYASDYKEISALKALADKYNVCILLIHHLRKQIADDSFQQIAGSNCLMGAADTSWVMQRKRMSQTASILVTGRDMDNKTLRLHEENCVWILDEEESAEQTVAKAVPDYLWKHQFPSLQAIVDYRKDLSQQIESLAAQRAEIVKMMRRKDAPPELTDRRAMLTCQIAELRKEDKIAEGAIKRIQRTRETNRIDRENRMPQHSQPRRHRREQERE